MSDLQHVQLKAKTAPRKIARDVRSYAVEAAFLNSAAVEQLLEGCPIIDSVTFYELLSKPERNRK